MKLIQFSYVNKDSALGWNCLICGHNWKASWNNIKKGIGCPSCAGKAPKTEENFKTWFSENRSGWEFLSSSKSTGKWIVEVLCPDHHPLSIRWDSLLNNNYKVCPICQPRGRKPRDPEKKFRCMGVWVTSLEGESKRVTDPDSYISEGWILGRPGMRKEPPTNPSKEERMLNKIREWAQCKGWELLSTSYSRKDHPLDWKCNDGHHFSMPWVRAQAGEDCMECYRNQHKPDKVVWLASNLPWVTLVQEGEEKDLFRCSEGHEWERPWRYTRDGHGCPVCKKVGERKIAAILKELDIKFLPQHPIDCPINKKGKLYLDFFLPELKVVIEFDGAQHFSYIPFMHNNDPELFEHQRKKDAWLAEQCSILGWRLLRIPFYEKDIRGILLKFLQGV